MKKLLQGAIGLAALSMTAPASAADLAARPYTKAPPAIVAAIYDWSGFYVGLNGGGGWSRKCWDRTSTLGVAVVPAVAEGCHDATGGVVGGQAGFRWQSGAWVFGLEGQGDWARLRGSNLSPISSGFNVQGVPLPPNNNQSRINALGLFTGQVGYAWDKALWYVKGGAAVTSDKYRGVDSVTGLVNDRASETRWGGAVGTGIELAFAPNWSVAFEYDHMFMGNRTLTFTSAVTPGLITRQDNIRQDVDLATARINYRWGGPVVAKY
jgi:outer membrane immunogenic protein